MGRDNDNKRTNYEKLLETKELVFSAISVIVVALNLWLGTKLAPLAKDISGLQQRVSAFEEDIQRVDRSCKNADTEIHKALARIEGRVDAIYNHLVE